MSQGRLLHSSNITGYVGEHLAVVDLLKKGIYANLAGAQFPYDVVADVNGRVYRVQVKAAAAPTNTIHRAKNGYDFRMNHKFEGIDIVAFVAVDIGAIGYLPAFKCDHSRMQFKAPGTLHHGRRKGFNLDYYTLENAIKELHEKERSTNAHQAKVFTQR